MIKKSNSTFPTFFKVEHEIEIMMALQHQRIIQLYDAYSLASAKQMCLILELIDGGELFERVADEQYVLTERAVVGKEF